MSNPIDGAPEQIRGLVAAEQRSAYERWELPVVDGPNPTSSGPMSASQLEALQRSAYDEGFDQGHAQGVQQGLSQTADRMAPALAALNEAAERLADLFSELDAEAESALVDLAMTVARSVVHREPSVDPEVIIDVLRAGVAALPQTHRTVIAELNPEDVALVQEVLGSSVEQQGWQLQANREITRGGCVIHSESSRVDITVENRLTEVISHVLGGP